MDLLAELAGAGLAFLLSCGLTGMIRTYALKKRLLDHPNHRSSHTVPTPRGGGLAIVLTFISVCALFSRDYLTPAACWAMVSGGLLVAAVGWVDDCGHVAAGWRIIFHGLAVALGLSWLGGVPALAGGLIPAGPALNCAAGLALLWLLNLFNFMDGIDGLAAMEAVFVTLAAAFILLCLAGWSREVRLLVLLAMSCLGFLAWNWPPAKIFMGDAGSGFLGYILGVAAVLTVQAGVLTLPVWLILLATFWVDATLTLLGRLWQGERWWEAHSRHAYQRAARRYGAHKTVTFGVLAINIFWLLPMAFLVAARPAVGWPLVPVAVLPLVLLVRRQGS